MAMAVKVREEGSLGLGLREIDDQHASLWFEHAADLPHTLLAHLARQMMEHERAQHRVELCVFERERFRDCRLERHLETGLCCLRRRPCDHLGRRIDAKRVAAGADLTLGNYRKTSGSASDIEHRFT